MTYANVASTTALVIAIGGGGAAVAASMLPANSVGSKQIINNSVKSQDIKDNKVTGNDVNEHARPGSVGGERGQRDQRHQRHERHQRDERHQREHGRHRQRALLRRDHQPERLRHRQPRHRPRVRVEQLRGRERGPDQQRLHLQPLGRCRHGHPQQCGQLHDQLRQPQHQRRERRRLRLAAAPPGQGLPCGPEQRQRALLQQRGRGHRQPLDHRGHGLTDDGGFGAHARQAAPARTSVARRASRDGLHLGLGPAVVRLPDGERCTCGTRTIAFGTLCARRAGRSPREQVRVGRGAPPRAGRPRPARSPTGRRAGRPRRRHARRVRGQRPLDLPRRRSSPPELIVTPSRPSSTIWLSSASNARSPGTENRTPSITGKVWAVLAGSPR